MTKQANAARSHFSKAARDFSGLLSTESELSSVSAEEREESRSWISLSIILADRRKFPNARSLERASPLRAGSEGERFFASAITRCENNDSDTSVRPRRTIIGSVVRITDRSAFTDISIPQHFIPCRYYHTLREAGRFFSKQPARYVPPCRGVRAVFLLRFVTR